VNSAGLRSPAPLCGEDREVLLKKKFSVLWAAAIMLGTVLACSGIALAITNGTIDDGQNGHLIHPNVGALVDETGAYCSGTLVKGAENQKYNQPAGAPVFLTADHCLPWEGNTSYVTFDLTYEAEGEAFDPGVPPANPEDPPEEPDGLYRGTFIENPQWWLRGNDIAVVVFDRNDPDYPTLNTKVTDGSITLAELPAQGRLSNLEKGRKFTAVGYGVTETGTGAGTRRYAVSRLTSTNSYFLGLSQNVNQDNSGTCNGDSGGPNFVWTPNSTRETNINAALTNTGDAVCKSKNTVLRLDTQAAYSYLVGNKTVRTADDYVSPQAFVTIPPS
jgi:hypothetical protein